MEVTELQAICKKAYCNVCFENFDALNRAAEDESLSLAELEKKFEEQLEDNEITDKGRKLIFCMKCKSTFHAGCYKPKTTFPIEIRISNKKRIKIDYFECPNCLEEQVYHMTKCSLCGLSKGFRVPLTIIREQSQDTGMEIEGENFTTEQGFCHVVCGLTNGGTYQLQRQVELDWSTVSPRAERRCIYCDQLCERSFTKCSDCNIHLHLFCNLHNNAERIIDDIRNKQEHRPITLRVVERPMTADTSLKGDRRWSPDFKLNSLIDDVNRDVQKAEFLSSEEASWAFEAASFKKLLSFNKAFSTLFSVEFRCAHHNKQHVADSINPLYEQHCLNCNRVYEPESQHKDKGLCIRCKVLRKVSQFESKKDFWKNEQHLNALAEIDFSVYDRLFLGRVFYDRLVFIMPSEAPQFEFLKGFKLIKKRLPEELTNDFVDSLFKQMRIAVIGSRLMRLVQGFQFTELARDFEHAGHRLMKSLEWLPERMSEGAQKMCSFLAEVSQKIAKLTKSHKSLADCVETFESIMKMKELKDSQFIKEVQGSFEKTKTVIEALFGKVDELKRHDVLNPFRLLELKTVVSEFLQAHETIIDTDHILTLLLLVFLAQNDLVEDYQKTIQALGKSESNYIVLKSAVDRFKFEGRIRSLDVVLSFKRQSDAIMEQQGIEGQQMTEMKALQLLSGFTHSASDLLGNIAKSENKKVSHYSELLKNHLLTTCDSVKKFLEAQVQFKTTDLYHLLEVVYKRSAKTAAVFRTNLSFILHSIASNLRTPTEQLETIKFLLQDYFAIISNHECFIDELFIKIERTINEFDYITSFIGGKLSKDQKVVTIIKKTLNYNYLNDFIDFPSFQTWMNHFLPRFNSEVVPQAEARVKAIHEQVQSLKFRTFAAFSNDNFGITSPQITVREVYEELERLENFPFKNFEKPIEFLNQVKVIIEAIKRTISQEMSIMPCKLVDIMNQLVATDRWMDIFKKSNRLTRFVSCVLFFMEVPNKTKAVETFFYPVLQVTLQRKLEELTTDKLCSIRKINQFLRMLSFSIDETFKRQVFEYRFLKLFQSFMSSLYSLFTDQKNLHFLAFYVSEAQLSVMRQTVVKACQTVGINTDQKTAVGPVVSETGIVKNEVGSLETLRYFLKNLSDFLEKSNKFEIGVKMEKVLNFLTDCQKVFQSLNLVYILSKGDAEVWTKVNQKYNSSIEKLEEHVRIVRDMNSRVNNTEISTISMHAQEVADVYNKAVKMIAQFGQRQSKAQVAEFDAGRAHLGLVTLESLCHVKDAMQDYKSFMKEAYEEVKTIIEFIENFEINLTMEVDNLIDVCCDLLQGRGTFDVDPQRLFELRKSQLAKFEKTCLGATDVEAAKPPDMKQLKSKFYDTRILFTMKSFSSPGTLMNLKKYKWVYDLYKLFTLSKSLQDIEAFIDKTRNHLTFELSSDKEISLVETLNRFLELCKELTTSEHKNIDIDILDRIQPLKQLIFPGFINSENQEEMAVMAGLLAVKFAYFEAREPIIGLKSNHLKLAAYAIFQSGLSVTPRLAEEIFSQLFTERRLVQFTRNHKNHETFVTQYAVESYVDEIEFSSPELEDITGVYMTQVDKLLNVFHRAFESPYEVAGSLTPDIIANAFEIDQISDKKAELLRVFCNRPSVVKFAIMCQRLGFGQLNSLNYSLQTLLDAVDQPEQLESLVKGISSEKNKTITINKETLTYQKSFRTRPTDRGLFTLFSELRLVDQIDHRLVFLAQLSLLIHIYFALIAGVIVVKIKELKQYFLEIKNVATNLPKIGLQAQTAELIIVIMKAIWAKADEIINETERYVASLSSITIDVDTVFKFKSIVSTSDMIEGIHEVNSKWVDSQNPWPKQTINLENEIGPDWANEAYSQIEDSVLSIFDEQLSQFKEQAKLAKSDQLEETKDVIVTEIDIQKQEFLTEQELLNAKDPKRKGEKLNKAQKSGEKEDGEGERIRRRKPSVEVLSQHENESPKLLNNLTAGKRPRSPKPDEGYLEISEDDQNEPDSPAERMPAGGTLEGMLGLISSWKKYSKAVRANPRFKEQYSGLLVNAFAKKLEDNVRRLAVFYSHVSDEEFEEFLSSYKDINILVDRYSSSKLNYESLLSLVKNPKTRLKNTQKDKKDKVKSKAANNNLLKETLDEIEREYEERNRSLSMLNNSTAETRDLPSGQDQLGVRRATPTPDEEDRLLMEAIEPKRVKPSAIQLYPITTLWALNSVHLTKIQFLDDKSGVNDKVVISDVQFYTTEDINILSTFPEVQKPIKFKTSEMKKTYFELKKDFSVRNTHKTNMFAGFVFLPIKKLQNLFCSEFEHGLLVGYAVAPNLQIYLAHSTMLEPEFFQSLNIYYPEEDDREFSDAFVCFFKRLEKDNSSPDLLQVEKRYESDDASFEKVRNRKIKINQLQISYFNAVKTAFVRNVQPHIYFKMGPKILEIEDVLAQKEAVMGSQQPAVGPIGQDPQGYYQGMKLGIGIGTPAGYLPPGMESMAGRSLPGQVGYVPPGAFRPPIGVPQQPIFGGYGVPPVKMPAQGYPPILPRNPANPQASLLSELRFEKADPTPPAIPIRPTQDPSLSNTLTAEEQEIKEMIIGETIDDLAEIFTEATQEVKDSIMKVMRLERPEEYPAFIAKVR